MNPTKETRKAESQFYTAAWNMKREDLLKLNQLQLIEWIERLQSKITAGEEEITRLGQIWYF